MKIDKERDFISFSLQYLLKDSIVNWEVYFICLCHR